MLDRSIRGSLRVHVSTPAAAPRVVPLVRRVLPVVCTYAPLSSQTKAIDTEAAEKKDGVSRLFFQRGSVYKARRVLDIIRGKSYEDALLLMEHMPLKACESVRKVLLEAAHNAKHHKGALKSRLRISECHADKGPVMKRPNFRARGRTDEIEKPTFHMVIRVEEGAGEGGGRGKRRMGRGGRTGVTHMQPASEASAPTLDPATALEAGAERARRTGVRVRTKIGQGVTQIAGRWWLKRQVESKW